MPTMTASQFKAKLQRDLSEKEAAADALQAERVKLALPAHSGDEAPMLRLQDIRADVDKRHGKIKDLLQAISDVQPAVETELAKVRLEVRTRTYAAFQALAADVMRRAAAIDAEIGRLVEVYDAAEVPIIHLRTLAVELLVPMGPGSDVSRVVSNRMVAAATINFGSVRDRLDTALDRRLSGRPSFELEAVFRDVIKAVDVRAQDGLKTDRATA